MSKYSDKCNQGNFSISEATFNKLPPANGMGVKDTDPSSWVYVVFPHSVVCMFHSLYQHI